MSGQLILMERLHEGSSGIFKNKWPENFNARQRFRDQIHNEKKFGHSREPVSCSQALDSCPNRRFHKTRTACFGKLQATNKFLYSIDLVFELA